MKKLIIILITIFWCVNAFAVDYFVKNGGDDAKSGLDDTNAWETIAKINGETFSAGDNIYFNRGDTWAENMLFPSSGSSGNPITIGAYGSGELPHIDAPDAQKYGIRTNDQSWLTFRDLKVTAPWNGSEGHSIQIVRSTYCIITNFTIVCD